MLALAPVALLAFAAAVNAQAAQLADSIPAACASSCTQTLEVSTLCSAQYESDNDLSACFCAALPSDVSDCATCLSGQGLTDAADTLSQTTTACPAAEQACTFACGFDTCASTTGAECQCAEDYLQNILNCATCNSDQGNTGVTLLSDYETLATSCAANNYTVPDAAAASPSPTGQDSYTMPTLASSVADSSATESIVTEASITSNAVGADVTSVASSASLRSVASSSRASSSRASSSAPASASASASSAPTSGAEKVLSAGGALGLLALVGFFL